MWTDTIVEEIHRIREEYAASFNNDLEAIFTDLRRKQAASGKQVVNLSRQPHGVSRWSGQGSDRRDEAANHSGNCLNS